MKNYRVAAIGTGMIFNGAHMPAILSLDGRLEFVAVCDERQDAAIFTARKLGVPYYTNPEKMISEVKPDILVVCTPNATHVKYSIMGLKAGAHVICEKPVALKREEGIELLKTAKRVGRRFFPAQTGRFTYDQQIARDWVNSGLIGDPYFADISIIRRRGVPRWGQFHIKAHNLGGAFADMAVHSIDSLLAMCGNPAFVSTSAHFYTGIVQSGEKVMISNKESGAFSGTFIPRLFDHTQMDVEEFAVGVIQLKNNMTISFRTAWAIDLPDDIDIKIIGTKGGLDMAEMKLYQTIGGCQATVDMKAFDNTRNAVPNWGHWECYAAILDDLDGVKAYPVKEDEFINTTTILEAVYSSAAIRKEVRAEDIVK